MPQGLLDRPPTAAGIGFFSLEVRRGKTNYTLEKKRRFLPVVALLFGLGDGGWVSAWRRACDSVSSPTNGQFRFPTVCKINSEGAAAAVAASSGEIGEMLREVPGVDCIKPNIFRPHIKGHPIILGWKVWSAFARGEAFGPSPGPQCRLSPDIPSGQHGSSVEKLCAGIAGHKGAEIHVR